jgi:hypothetical protein
MAWSVGVDLVEAFDWNSLGDLPAKRTVNEGE